MLQWPNQYSTTIFAFVRERSFRDFVAVKALSGSGLGVTIASGAKYLYTYSTNIGRDETVDRLAEEHS
jgi:hypothetical protein